MGNHFKFCNNERCRTGMRASLGEAVLKRTVRRIRRAAKRALRLGEEPAPAVSIGRRAHLD
jgi:hypothetical protein